MRTIELTDDQADELVVSELICSMNSVVIDIIRLRDSIENSDLTFSYTAIRHDLTYDLAYLDAVYTVLKHFTTHDSPERKVIDGLKHSIHNAEEYPRYSTNTHKKTDR